MLVERGRWAPKYFTATAWRQQGRAQISWLSWRPDYLFTFLFTRSTRVTIRTGIIHCIVNYKAIRLTKYSRTSQICLGQAKLAITNPKRLSQKFDQPGRTSAEAAGTLVEWPEESQYFTTFLPKLSVSSDFDDDDDNITAFDPRLTNYSKWRRRFFFHLSPNMITRAELFAWKGQLARTIEAYIMNPTG